MSGKAQPLWDQYETALLIDACWRIETGEIARTDAVRLLSGELRKRALDHGLEIDEIYRNENGISGQLGKVQRLMRHVPGAEQHNTKIFVYMVNMFHNDRQQYEKILAEAKGEESVKTNQEKFMEWLSGRVSSTLLSDYYLALSDVERIAQERGIISGSMYDITEASDVARIQTALESPRVKAGRSKSDLRKMTVAVQFLLLL